jgi:pantoate--beta-alanine ligase
MDRARELAGPHGQVAVSIFVNPTQFAPGEDFSRYPRSWDEDLAACAAHGVDLVFAPTAEDLYSAGTDISIDPGPLGTVLEGAVRPGHFRGVLTVVAKLMNLMCPSHAVYGEKDFQQLALITRMVASLNLPVVVVPVPTVREPDGLAMSSRNAYLSADDRATAAVIPRATAAAVAAAESGARAGDVVAAAEQILEAEPGVELDYVALSDPEFGHAPAEGPARLLVAAKIGPPRLLDNVPLVLAPE